MERIREFIQWRYHSSPPVRLGNRLITLQSQALSVRFPFGGFVWNRPTGVVVEQDGQIEHLPIQDATRQALFAMALATLTVTLLSGLIRLSRSSPAQATGSD